MRARKNLAIRQWAAVLAISGLLINPHFTIAAEPAKTFAPEPWYEANPLSRLIASYFAAGFNLLRLDRIGNPGESYLSRLSDAMGSAVGHTLGILGDSANDLSRAFLSLGSIGMDDENAILQCTSILPTGPLSSVTGGATQLKHTWLQIGDMSYGMPFTLDNGYFGGPAGIMSPDPLVRWQSPNGIICTPIRFPKNISPDARLKNTQCIASQLALGDIPSRSLDKFINAKPNKATRGAVLDYHAFANNCLSAVNYLVSCAGGEISQKPNMGVGGSIPWDKEAFRFMKSSDASPSVLIPETNSIIFALGDMKSLAFQLIKGPRENNGFFRRLLENQRQSLIEKLVANPILNNSYAEMIRELRGLDLEFDSPSVIRSVFDLSLTRVNMRLLGEITGVEKTTYQGACEAARNVCGI